MNWYKIAQISNYDPQIINHPDFVGFHCQNRPRDEGINIYDDYIKNNNEYAKDYYLLILDALPNYLHNKAKQLNLFEKPEDNYSEEFEEWGQKVYEFLRLSNIKWIFVSANKPLKEQYGKYCYYVLMPKSIILEIFDDPFVNDMAWAYVYDGNIGNPICKELEAINELV